MGKAISIDKQKMHRVGGACVIRPVFLCSPVFQKGGL
jgi:hypothetical protein